MDALIMAAGRGSRLGDETNDRPKSLVDLGGVTPLELQIDALVRHEVGRAIVVVGYRADMIRAAAERRARGAVALEFVLNPFWSVTNVLGSAWFARHQLRGEVLYLHADTVFAPSILSEILASRADAALPVDIRACEPEQMKAEVISGRVAFLSKDLPPERAAGEFIGIGVFRRRVDTLLTAVDELVSNGDFNAYFESAINLAISRGMVVEAVDVGGRPWTEIDFVDDLEFARRSLPSFI